MDMARELSRDSGDKVIVLHVHGFVVGALWPDAGGLRRGKGEGVVDGIVARLKDARVAAEGEIREAQLGHIARNIKEAFQVLFLSTHSR